VKKRNRSGARTKKLLAKAAAEKAEQHRTGAYGPADPMPDGKTRQARKDAITHLKTCTSVDRLSPVQEAAANEIEKVFLARCSDCLTKAQSLERVDKEYTAGTADWLIDAGRRYDKFAKWSKLNAQQTGINVHMLLLDIYMDGLTLNQCDLRLRKRHLSSKKAIIEGLSMYGILAGWTKIAA